MERELIKSGQRFGGYVLVDFEIGNTYKEITENITLSAEGFENRHSWKVFVRIKDKKLRPAIRQLIDKIQIGMWGVEYLERSANDIAK